MDVFTHTHVHCRLTNKPAKTRVHTFYVGTEEWQWSVSSVIIVLVDERSEAERRVEECWRRTEEEERRRKEINATTQRFPSSCWKKKTLANRCCCFTETPPARYFTLTALYLILFCLLEFWLFRNALLITDVNRENEERRLLSWSHPDWLLKMTNGPRCVIHHTTNGSAFHSASGICW